MSEQSGIPLLRDDDDLRAFGFGNDQQRLDAKLAASLYREGFVKEAGEVLGVALGLGNWKRMLPLVLDELNGKRRKSDLKPIGINIVRAYCNAAYCLSQRGDAPVPTVFEGKREYVRLFAREEVRPRNQSIRCWLSNLASRNLIPHHGEFLKTFRRCEFPYRQDRRGAPRK
jgi:hypothetical protein